MVLLTTVAPSAPSALVATAKVALMMLLLLMTIRGAMTAKSMQGQGLLLAAMLARVSRTMMTISVGGTFAAMTMMRAQAVNEQR